MRLLSEFGTNIHIDDELLPEDARDYTWQNAYLLQDCLELTDCWVATICKKQFCSGEMHWEYVGEKMFDHIPSKNELLALLAKYNAIYNGYVCVDKCKRVIERDAE